MKKIITTTQAPAAIGSYSQAVQVGNTVYLSGQIPLDPQTNTLVEGDIAAQIHCVFRNIQAVALAAGGSLHHVVKITVYLMDLSHIVHVNELMKTYFTQSFPARTSIQVSSLPKNANVEIEAIMVLD